MRSRRGQRRERRFRIKVNAKRRDMRRLHQSLRRLFGSHGLRFPIYGRDGRWMDQDRALAMELVSRKMLERHQRVALTFIGGVAVSTVWLRLQEPEIPHLVQEAFGQHVPRAQIAFETICFHRNFYGAQSGEDQTLWGMPQARYTHEWLARIGHERICEVVEAWQRNPNCDHCGKPCPFTLLCAECESRQRMQQLFDPLAPPTLEVQA